MPAVGGRVDQPRLAAARRRGRCPTTGRRAPGPPARPARHDPGARRASRSTRPPRRGSSAPRSTARWTRGTMRRSHQNAGPVRRRRRVALGSRPMNPSRCQPNAPTSARVQRRQAATQGLVGRRAPRPGRRATRAPARRAWRPRRPARARRRPRPASASPRPRRRAGRRAARRPTWRTPCARRPGRRAPASLMHPPVTGVTRSTATPSAAATRGRQRAHASAGLAAQVVDQAGARPLEQVVDVPRTRRRPP